MTSNAEIHATLAHIKEQYVKGEMDFAEARLLDHFWRSQLKLQVSDTPPRGPEGNSGHPATPGPHNNKEIA